MMFGGSMISCASTLALAATTFHGSSAAHDEHHSDDSVSTSFRAFVDHRENEGRAVSTQSSGFLAGGNFFMPDSCPFIVSGLDEATERRTATSMEGNVIELASHDRGRTGNRFLSLSSYLAMGFCCKSRLLTLPESDDVMPQVETGSPFTAAHRWFNFQDAEIPWEEYQGLSEDPKICRPNTVDGGAAAFRYEHVHQELLGCMNKVKLRGCEAAYLGSLVDKDRACSRRDTEKEEERRTGAGSLVIHMRSGDIFNSHGIGARADNFGQPPLQFYLFAIASQPWDDVMVITATERGGGVDPAFTALETIAESGVLRPQIRMLKGRTLLEDLDSMLCADGLVAARSSLTFLMFGHTRATRLFIPDECGDGHWRMGGSGIATYDNTTLLALEKPDAEVYGIRWKEGGPEDYSVYKEWHDTDPQLMEMITYTGIAGLQQCAVELN